MNDLPGHLLVKLVLILIKFFSEVLLSIFDLTTQLLDVLGCLGVLNYFEASTRAIPQLRNSLIDNTILGHVSEDWKAG